MKSESTSSSLSRRSVLSKGAMAFGGVQFLNFPIFGQDAPSNRLNLVGIGIGGMGRGNLRQCSKENIAVLCDVDEKYSARTRGSYPHAKFYTDYREMLDSETDLDGAVIATPDHTHALITQAVMDKGLHVYTQKPLTHTVHEARVLTDLAAEKTEIQTQMGNQGRSSDNMRRLKEWIDAGAIGNVTEVHAWTDRPVGGQSYSTFPLDGRPAETPEVPDLFDWDLWLGPAPERPYHPIYHPGTWRGFYDFGTGPLGDMGCHILDPAFYALDLGAPTTVEATSTHWEEAISSETYPRATRVRYQFPARDGKTPVTINWSDGRLLPFRPKALGNDVQLPASGALLIGDEGVILHGSHGAHALTLFPENRAKELPRQRTGADHSPCRGFPRGGLDPRLQGRQARQFGVFLRRRPDRNGPARRARHPRPQPAARMGSGSDDLRRSRRSQQVDPPALPRRLDSSRLVHFTLYRIRSIRLEGQVPPCPRTCSDVRKTEPRPVNSDFADDSFSGRKRRERQRSTIRTGRAGISRTSQHRRNTKTSMPLVDPLPADSDAEIAELARFFNETLGFTPNSVLTMQHRPAIARAFIGLNMAVMENRGRVTSALKRLLGYVASQAAGCRYCQAHTIRAAERYGAEREQLENIWQYRSHPAFSEAERAALDLAAAAATVPNAVDNALEQRLREHWDEGEIVEILGVISLFGYLNRWNDSMATTLERGAEQSGADWLSDTGWQAGKHGDDG